MNRVDLILAGLGGQGILFMTKILARAAMDRGEDLMGAETHGMAQRGGSVVSHLRLGGVSSSLVGSGSAQFVLALEENEAYRNLPYLATEGGLYVNSRGNSFPRAEVAEYLARKKIACRSLPAGRIAIELGAPLSSNLALLGYFSAYERQLARPEELRKTIEKVSPERFRSINLKVFDAGVENALAQP